MDVRTHTMVMVTISFRHQWGDEQQQTIQEPLRWQAFVADGVALKVESAVRDALTPFAIEGFARRSEGAERFLDAMGKNKQCELPLKEVNS